MGILASMFGKGSGNIKYLKGKFVMKMADKEMAKFIEMLTRSSRNVTVSGVYVTVKVTNDIESEDLLQFFKHAGIII